MNANGKDEPDLMVEGFHRLDGRTMVAHPPKIQWGVIYKEKSDADKIKYLEKLAATMNHAAFLVQEERNSLGALCEKKEGQLQQMMTDITANNNMLQSEVTKMNEQRQGFNQEVARLNAKIRELEGGDHH